MSDRLGALGQTVLKQQARECADAGSQEEAHNCCHCRPGTVLDFVAPALAALT